MQIRTVAVLGSGLMGSGIARACASANLHTILIKARPGSPDSARQALDGALSKEVQKGRLSEALRQEVLAHLRFSNRLAEVRDVDLVIESIVEDRAVKQELLRAADRLAKPEAIFASNTSTLCITELAAVTSRPERLVGLHFFNPVGAMKLVEIVPTLATAAEVLAAVQAFARALGKTPVLVRDATGFIVNRLLTPYLLDAMRALEQGLATLVEIDQSMQLGCGHPMGPFALADFIGLDVVFAMAENLYQEYKEPRFAPPPLLRRMTLAGLLGRKSGRGFYDYSCKPARANPLLGGKEAQGGQMASGASAEG